MTVGEMDEDSAREFEEGLEEEAVELSEGERDRLVTRVAKVPGRGGRKDWMVRLVSPEEIKEEPLESNNNQQEGVEDWLEEEPRLVVDEEADDTMVRMGEEAGDTMGLVGQEADDTAEVGGEGSSDTGDGLGGQEADDTAEVGSEGSADTGDSEEEEEAGVTGPGVVLELAPAPFLAELEGLDWVDAFEYSKLCVWLPQEGCPLHLHQAPAGGLR